MFSLRSWPAYAAAVTFLTLVPAAGATVAASVPVLSSAAGGEPAGAECRTWTPREPSAVMIVRCRERT
ncbi:hypothetical protein [Nonomuraea sp. NPDC049504]|uniref:hypothetical protein n=1 Tax=Nonomuraea sp. NPDC049504 TaxID=3154729 RepID=UPI003423E890